MAPEMPTGDVQLGADRLARLPHLLAMIAPAGIDNRPARADGSIPERRSQVLEQLEVRRLLEATSARNNDGRFGDVEHGRIRLLDAPGYRTSGERRYCERRDGSRLAARNRMEGVRANRHHRRRAGELCHAAGPCRRRSGE